MSWYSGSQLTMRSAWVRPSTWLKSWAWRCRSAAEKRIALRWPVVPDDICRIAKSATSKGSAGAPACLPPGEAAGSPAKAVGRPVGDAACRPGASAGRPSENGSSTCTKRPRPASALARSHSARASPVACTACEIDASQYRRVCLRVGYCITSGWAPASTQPSQATTSSGPDGNISPTGAPCGTASATLPATARMRAAWADRRRVCSDPSAATKTKSGNASLRIMGRLPGNARRHHT